MTPSQLTFHTHANPNVLVDPCPMAILYHLAASFLDQSAIALGNDQYDSHILLDPVPSFGQQESQFCCQYGRVNVHQHATHVLALRYRPSRPQSADTTARHRVPFSPLRRLGNNSQSQTCPGTDPAAGQCDRDLVKRTCTHRQGLLLTRRELDSPGRLMEINASFR
jgi:hypothetical protein